MRFKKQLLSICLLLCIILSTGYFLATANLRFIYYTPAPCPESAKELSNPYVGWYQVRRYLLSDTADFDLPATAGPEQKPGLVLLEINLQNYADRPISSVGLSHLHTLFQAWASAEKQLIVRFLYDWDGNATEQEPKERSLILKHMSQAASVVNAYSDRIYILQGVFIGSWGEMHGSDYANPEDIRILMDHLSTVISPDIFLAVRTPEQWRLVTGRAEPVSAEQAFDPSLPARLGLFNDGMLGSDTDLNTYRAPSSEESSDSFGKRSREEEIRFQNLLCASVPNGGEVVIDNPLNDFAAAAAYFQETHVSYLNSAYDEAVLSKWKADSYKGEGVFHGMNGYDYIGRHLGYRYVLRDFACTPPGLPGETGLFSVTLENIGFSGAYHPFELTLSLTDINRGRAYTIPVRTDLRPLAAGTKTTLNIPFDSLSCPTGIYRLCLKISDPVTGCEVHPANDMAHTADGYVLGNLEIRSFPKLSQ